MSDHHFDVPQVFVQNGTHAGWRPSYAGDLPPNWRCDKCGAEVRGTWRSCPNNPQGVHCGSPRPF